MKTTPLKTVFNLALVSVLLIVTPISVKSIVKDIKYSFSLEPASSGLTYLFEVIQ